MAFSRAPEPNQAESSLRVDLSLGELARVLIDPAVLRLLEQRADLPRLLEGVRKALGTTSQTREVELERP